MPDPAAGDPGLRAALRGVRGLLLDLDGVLVAAGRAVEGAADALADLERRAVPYLVATNTTLVSRATLARHLADLGFAIPPERLHTAASASAALVRREYDGRRVYLITSDDAFAEFEGIDVLRPEGDPLAARSPADVAAVVLGDSPAGAARGALDVAFRLVRRGADLVGMHRNAWWTTADGEVLDSGAFLVALEYATGVRARIAGKPSRAFFAEAATRLATDAGRRREPRLRRRDLAMVGDDLVQDVAGGRRAGLRTVFVRTGKHGETELAAAGQRTRVGATPAGFGRPDAVAPSIVEVVAALA